MARCIVVCLIVANCTNINDKGKNIAIWCLKITNFNEFLEKYA